MDIRIFTDLRDVFFETSWNSGAERFYSNMTNNSNVIYLPRSSLLNSADYAVADEEQFIIRKCN